MFKIVATGVSKKFNERSVLENIDFQLSSGQSLAITGQNGSGKTTLIKIISGLLSPTEGKIEFYNSDEKVDPEQIYSHIGLVGPYLQLYHHLTAWENISFFFKIRGLEVDKSKILKLTRLLGLEGREFDYVKNYSSGMQQRLKYVAALLHEPEILLVDEPTSNLDEKGAEIVYGLLKDQIQSKMLIVATNNPEERQFGQKRIHVGL